MCGISFAHDIFFSNYAYADYVWGSSLLYIHETYSQY